MNSFARLCMNMKRNLTKWFLIAGVAVMAAGCISHNETVYRDVKRVSVRFENDAAARLFYETLNRNSGGQYPQESSTQIKVPFVFKYRTRVVSGPNAAFNNAVKECDLDRDGTISETEARSFSQQRG
jgi:hypothetical protein